MNISAYKAEKKWERSITRRVLKAIQAHGNQVIIGIMVFAMFYGLLCSLMVIFPD